LSRSTSLRIGAPFDRLHGRVEPALTLNDCILALPHDEVSRERRLIHSASRAPYLCRAHHRPIATHFGLMHVESMDSVPLLEWDLTDMRDASRMRRLVHPPDCEALIVAVAHQARQNVNAAYFFWETAQEKIGYQRIVAQVPIEAETFDFLFNGRTGYRAQLTIYHPSREQNSIKRAYRCSE
jgi:hypothetical protein